MIPKTHFSSPTSIRAQKKNALWSVLKVNSLCRFSSPPRSLFSRIRTLHNAICLFDESVAWQVAGATGGSEASANRQPTAPVHTVLMHDHLLWTEKHTHSHRYTENMRRPEVRSWEMRSCRAAGVHTDTHPDTHSNTHRHLHGGPLQRHSSTCTALSENASEEGLTIQMGHRQTHKRTRLLQRFLKTVLPSVEFRQQLRFTWTNAVLWLQIQWY